jgi:hypothetical protein
MIHKFWQNFTKTFIKCNLSLFLVNNSLLERKNEKEYKKKVFMKIITNGSIKNSNKERFRITVQGSSYEKIWL